MVAGAIAALVAAAAYAALRPAGGELSISSFTKARGNSVTVTLPPPVTDRIFAGPRSAGRPIVVIDPGHGGRDPGATAASGNLTEKQLTLALAREVRDILVKRGRVRVAMTRNDDAYLTLEDRAAVARRLDASLFLSIHMDSAPNPLARGATVYSLSDVASDADAERFARSENAQAVIGGNSADPVETLLSELSLRSQMTASADLAARMVRKASGRVELRPDPHRFAAFHVLRSAGTAAVLLEAGYLSNAEDEALLASPEHRARIALALAQAIEADVAARAQR
jgi:N-acetylmuramoyl-L-alanine amidase